MISIDEFKKLDISNGKIETAARILDSDKLLRLEVNLRSDPSTSSGRDTRQIVVGIAQYYEPEKLIGREIPILANLEPRVLRGVESQGMLLAADGNGEPVLMSPDKDIPPGSIVK